MKASSVDHINLIEAYGTHNYSPLKVVIARGEGVWLWDVEGKKYFDMMSAYSAVNFGHCNKRFALRAKEQLERVTMVSRAFMHDQFGPFCKELAELLGMEMVLPMNSGAEAVETAIKAARRWAYQVKKVKENCAEIVCMANNFAGRTVTIVGFSTESAYQKDFGPFTPGFKVVPFGDAVALKQAVNENTAAVLLEPIQGEGGIIMPPDGFLRDVRHICSESNVLMIADEIQTGLCRTGKLLCCNHENVVPDLVLLGKSLGGGITPISAVVGSKSVLSLFNPGSHGSTFGGNSFACAIAREVIAYIKEEKPEANSAKLGEHLFKRLNSMKSKYIGALRGRGLMVGADIRPEFGKAKKFCELLANEGLLCKDTREQTIRFTPPLVVTKEELDWALDRVEKVFTA